MNPLRILHTDFHRGWGGQAARVLMLSGELARRGHRVTIAAPRGELTRRAAASGAGIAVVDSFHFHPPARVFSFLGDVRRMRSLLRSERFDIVDVHGSQDTWVTAMARPIAGGAPRRLVLTRHNTKRVRTNAANRALYGRLVDHLILVDESVRAQYAGFLSDQTIDPARISVIPSAYRADLFHGGVDGRPLRRALGIADDVTVIGVAGRLVRDKGHTHLFQAAERLRADGAPLALVLAGAGPLEAELKEEARARGLAPMTHFLGFRPDIAAVEAAFDIAVLPSVGCDASSAAIKESMALGIPIVASDIGGARVIIRDGETGLVVPPGDAAALEKALRILLADPARGRAMAQKARLEVAARYSIDRLADATLLAYETALAGAPVSQGARSAWRERPTL
jgi:glycosyltransferase involved in cell wall biosynthesis